MGTGAWEGYKQNFKASETLDLYLSVDGMTAGHYFEHAKIDDSKMIITV